MKLCNINLKTFIPIFVEQPCDQISATNNYYKWEPDYLNVFQKNMNDDYVCGKLYKITDTLNKDTDLITETDAEICITELNDVLEYVSKPLLHTSGKKSGTSKPNSHDTWYDDDCKEKGKVFKVARNVFLHSKSDTDMKAMCSIRNSYRKLCRKKKSMYKIHSANNLVKLSKQNSKLFWKKIRNKPKSPLPNLDFDNHFSNLFSSFPPDLSNNTVDILHAHETSQPIYNDFLDSDITMNELDTALKHLKMIKVPVLI